MCIDDELDRLGRHLFDLLDKGTGGRRLGVRVNDQDAVVEDDNRGIAIDLVGGLGNCSVDSVCDWMDLNRSSATQEIGTKRKRIERTMRFMELPPCIQL